jgi:hypothetical protein
VARDLTQLNQIAKDNSLAFSAGCSHTRTGRPHNPVTLDLLALVRVP